MNTTYRKPRATWIGRLTQATVFYVAALLAATALAQETIASIGASEKNAVTVLANQLGSGPSRVDAMLADVGFPPADFKTGPATGYDKWPTLRKLEAAYMTAADEGRQFLRVLSRNVAAMNANAARYEPSLRAFFDESPDARIEPDSRRFNFSRHYVQPTKPPSPQVRTLLLTLEKYTSGLPGGLQSLMAACCKLTQEQIYRTLVSSETNAAAIWRAVQESSVPPELRGKLRKMLLHAAERVHAFRYDDAFKPYLNGDATRYTSQGVELPDRFTAQATTDAEFERAISELAGSAAKSSGMPDQVVKNVMANGEAVLPAASHLAGVASTGGGAGIGPLGGSPAGGNPGGRGAGNAGRYLTVYSSIGGGGAGGGGGGMSFSKMSTSPRGFGGVVLGNRLTDRVAPRLSRVTWVADPGEASRRATGHFEFVFDDGVIGYSATLPEDLAYVAYTLLYTGVGEDWPPVDATDEGVGLAGVDDDATRDALVYPTLAMTGWGQLARLTRFVVHPGLDGLPAGYAAIEVDSLSFQASSDFIVERMRSAGASEAEQTAAREWHEAYRGYFKITDAPLDIERRADGYVDVLRSPTGRHDEGFRTVALLTTQTFDFADIAQDEFTTPFYDAVPGLVAAFPAFKDLNDLAEAFAIVRWARIEKASWDTRPSTPMRGESRTYVRPRADGGIELTANALEPGWVTEFIAAVESEASRLSRLAAHQQVIDELGTSLSELRRQRAAAAFAIDRLYASTGDDPETTPAQLEDSVAVLQQIIDTTGQQSNDLRQAAHESFVGDEEVTPRMTAIEHEAQRIAEQLAANSIARDTLEETSWDPAALSADERAKLGVLHQAKQAAEERFWSADIDSDEEAEALELVQNLDARIARLWPEDTRRMAELDAEMERLADRYRSLIDTYHRLRETSSVEASLEWSSLQEEADSALEATLASIVESPASGGRR